MCAVAAAVPRVLAATREVRPASHYDLAVPIKVVIAEDNALLREGLVAMFRERELDVVATAEDGAGLVRIQSLIRSRTPPGSQPRTGRWPSRVA